MTTRHHCILSVAIQADGALGVVAGLVETGLGDSGSGSSSSSPSGAPSLPLDAAVLAVYGFATTLSIVVAMFELSAE